MKNRIFKTLLIMLLSIGLYQQSFAGFPIGPGRWLLVPTYTNYTANSYWDANGTLKNYTNQGSFNSNYLGLYGGIGIDRDLDLLFNIPYVSNKFIENGQVVEGPLQTTGDIVIGLSYFLNHFDYYKHLALTGSIIIPTYPLIDSTTLLPGFASVGAEIKLGLAGTNTKRLKNTYYDLEAGIRSYFNAGGPTQFFTNATFGVPMGEDWKISATLNGVWSSGSSSSTAKALTQYVNKDFSYIRGSIALGRRLDRNITLWVSAFKDLTGTSIGQGQGFSIFAVIKF
jgi:protein XagA